jgi:hypothetical protein
MYLCIMLRKLDDLTPEEVILFNKTLNDDFKHFSVAYPDIEIGDTTDGTLIKLRAMPRTTYFGGEDFRMADIFFDLNWRFYTQKKRNPEVLKMIVSDLQLMPRLEGTAFPRGIAIKIKYLVKEKTEAEKIMEQCWYKKECECDCFMSCYHHGVNQIK